MDLKEAVRIAEQYKREARVVELEQWELSSVILLDFVRRSVTSMKFAAYRTAGRDDHCNLCVQWKEHGHRDDCPLTEARIAGLLD